MKLATRLTLLFAALFVGALAALVLLRWTQHRSEQALRSQLTEDKARQLARAIELGGSTLERFASDYTQWDEMCRFVAAPTPEWADINLVQSLASWRFHGIWLYTPARSEVYRHCRAPLISASLADFPSGPMLDRICGTERLHFFARAPQGVIELRTAPIHPSDDAHLTDPPQGWLIVARLWQFEDYAQLGLLVDGEVSDSPPSHGEGSSPQIHATHSLPDWTGAPVALLHLEHNSPLLGNMLDYDADEALLFVVVWLVFLLATGWFVHRWVHRPIRMIEAGLSTDQPELTAPLRVGRDEFSRIAHLIGTVAEQRRTLRTEIAHRDAAEQRLRHALEERIALGRNLHDGAIQSIYATGMALQGIGPLLRSDPNEAHRRIERCIEMLNATITQLRSHISGMEAEHSGEVSLEKGLAKLLQELRHVRSVDYAIHLDPLLAGALPQDSVVQLIYIAREAVSNALRHSGARRIGLRLDIVNGEPTFLVEDDGTGFEPGGAPRHGHGLDNMTRRAEEIGAALSIDSVPGRGTRLRVELPWTGLDKDAESAALPNL